MRKAFIILTGILFTLLCATCKQFTADIDGYLSYWSSEAFIRSSAIDTKTYNDGSGIVSVASAKDVTVTLKVQNPKSFRFVMPSASETRNIVGFAHFGGTKPAVSADYELKQPSADTLQLVYKKSFLKNSEWGEKDVSSTITLYANDGRVFKQTFTVPLKANTPPPNPGYTVAKTTSSPAYYVLCFTIPDMDKTVPGGLLHKDLARIEVNGTPYTFSVNEAQTAFTKPEAPVFITHSDVEKLTEPEADDVPADSSWVLYYKTDVEVKDGAAKKDYTIKLIDKKGLASGIVNASTKPNKAETEIVRITKGTKSSGSGTGSSDTDQIIIGTDSSGAEIRISSGTANTMVHCTLTDGSTPVKYDGNPVTVPLRLNGAGEKQYKLEYYTDGEGFAATPVKTIYYKVVKGHTVTFNANTGAYPGGATVVSKSVLYGSTVTEPNPPPVKPGYGVTGWYNNAGATGTAWNFATPVTGDITLYAKWTANVVSYKVEHYKQNINDDNYTLAETETKPGTTDASISDSDIKKNYEGFNYHHIAPADPKIGADGKTVVKVYYKRKTYTVTYSVDGSGSSGSISVTDVTGGSVGGSPVTVKHGGSITFKAQSNLAWKIEGWTLGITAVNGTDSTYILSNIKSDKAVKVKFKKVTTVKHTDDNAWTLLKNVVKIADDNAIITIDGKIQASSGNSGEIEIDKTLTIKGKRGAGSDILNANSMSRIFKVKSGKTLTLKDLTLTGGKADGAGGAIFASDAIVTITNCTITGNEAATNGGGLNIEGTPATITNCTFTRNTAKNGGGIYTIKTGSYPEVTISGGTIGDTDMDSANKATGSDGNGGGIYVGEFCTLRLQDSTDSGVRIIGNQAAKGGGVYAKNTIVSMQGRTQIEVDNNDVYLDSGSLISIVESLAATGPVARARITVPNDKYQTATKVLTGSAVNTEYRKFTVTPEKVTEDSENWNVFWYVAADGTLKTAVEDSSTLQSVINSRPNNTPFIIKLGNISNLETVEIPEHKKIMLKADTAVTLTCPKKWDDYKHLQVKEHASLTLKGQIKLQGADYGRNSQYALYVETGGTAEIKDNDVTITGFKNSWSNSGGEHAGKGPVFVDGTLTMSGGRIEKNIVDNLNGSLSSGGGGGVYVGGTGKFIMKGGRITENEASGYNPSVGGGGVYVDGSYNGGDPIRGQFTMEGGTIEKNKAYAGGGVLVKGIFNMKGGKITNNTSDNGRGVRVHDGTFDWYGGEITTNYGHGNAVDGPCNNQSGNTAS